MSQRHHLAGLDAIRFLAGLLVTTYHFFFTFWLSDSYIAKLNQRPVTLAPEAAYTWFGWVGVQIFFVLSGVVIAYSASKSSADKFVRDRVVRLAPIAWICALISLSVLLASDRELMDTVGRFARQVTFFPLGPWVDIPFWTLGVEISFYAVVLALLALNKFSYLARVVAIIGLTSAGFAVLDLFGCGASQTGILCPALHRFPRVPELLLLDHGCFFSVGVLIWKRYVAKQLSKIDWLLALSCVGCVVQIALKAMREDIVFSNQGIAIAQPWIVPVTIWLTAVGAIILSCGATSFPKSAQSFLRVLGLATYPLYLVHYNLGSVLIAHLYLRGASITESALAALACCLALSIALATFIEPRLQAPLRAALDQVLVAARTMTRRPAKNPAP